MPAASPMVSPPVPVADTPQHADASSAKRESGDEPEPEAKEAAESREKEGDRSRDRSADRHDSGRREPDRHRDRDRDRNRDRDRDRDRRRDRDRDRDQGARDPLSFVQHPPPRTCVIARSTSLRRPRPGPQAAAPAWTSRTNASFVSDSHSDIAFRFSSSDCPTNNDLHPMPSASRTC